MRLRKSRLLSTHTWSRLHMLPSWWIGNTSERLEIKIHAFSKGLRQRLECWMRTVVHDICFLFGSPWRTVHVPPILLQSLSFFKITSMPLTKVCDEPSTNAVLWDVFSRLVTAHNCWRRLTSSYQIQDYCPCLAEREERPEVARERARAATACARRWERPAVNKGKPVSRFPRHE